MSLNDPGAAIGYDRRHGDTAEKINNRLRRSLHPDTPVVQPEKPFDQSLNAPCLILFKSKGLDHPNTLKALRQQAGHGAHFLLRLSRNTAHPLAELTDRIGRERGNDKGDAGQQPILIKHHRNKEDDGQAIPAKANQRIRDRITHRIDIERKMRNQCPAVPILKKAEIKVNQVPVKPGLHVRNHALTDIADEHFLHIGGNTFHEESCDDRTSDHPQHRQIFLDENPVHHRVHQPCRCGRRGGNQYHAEYGKDQARRIGLYKIAQHTLQQREAGLVRNAGSGAVGFIGHAVQSRDIGALHIACQRPTATELRGRNRHGAG